MSVYRRSGTFREKYFATVEEIIRRIKHAVQYRYNIRFDGKPRRSLIRCLRGFETKRDLVLFCPTRTRLYGYLHRFVVMKFKFYQSFDSRKCSNIHVKMFRYESPQKRTVINKELYVYRTASTTVCRIS